MIERIQVDEIWSEYISKRMSVAVRDCTCRFCSMSFRETVRSGETQELTKRACQEFHLLPGAAEVVLRADLTFHFRNFGRYEK
jgi:hypothetical protein